MNIDSIIFYHELDLLELRFQELWDVVDKFVIVEMPLTFSSIPKPSYLRENWDRFKPYSSKIHSIIVKDIPEEPQPSWAMEVLQRNVQRNFNFKDEDLITLCDADEIPHPSVYANFQRKYDIAKLSQKFLTFWIDTEIPNVHWCKAAICTGTALRQNDPSAIRAVTPSISMYPGGWHFSSLGDPDYIKLKIQGFAAHQQPNVLKMLADPDCLRGKSLSQGLVKKIQITEEWPKAMLRNMDFWRKHQCDR